ncbi:MAG: (2Fe-2S) ferredoxin domain-containing protein [Synechococcales cyanobacterium M58_A2018_015]|nr:(2Fe-2S) ferredoxin domain-containing protein [Synechococcales cyanobacterium M58_A2018_015]
MVSSQLPAGRVVLICQNTACRKAGAAAVATAFEATLQAAAIPEVTLQRCRCLGQCGNGPMVLVLPEQIWYHRVAVDQVVAIVESHLQHGVPVQAWLYRKFHPASGRRSRNR